MEYLLTQMIYRHDVCPVSSISRVTDFSKATLVDFRKGKIEFKNPLRSELITIDSSERRLLSVFRKMNAELKNICVENINDKIRRYSSTSPKESSRTNNIKQILGRTLSKGFRMNTVIEKKDHSVSKKTRKKIAREKIERLKMITKSMSRITVK